MKKALLILAFGGIFALSGYSQCGAQIRLTDMVQQERIDGGVKSGKLTRMEGRKLQKKLFKLRKKRIKFMADGGLNRRERKTLARKHSVLGAAIYREKHDLKRAR